MYENLKSQKVQNHNPIVMNIYMSIEFDSTNIQDYFSLFSKLNGQLCTIK